MYTTDIKGFPYHSTAANMPKFEFNLLQPNVKTTDNSVFVKAVFHFSPNPGKDNR